MTRKNSIEKFYSRPNKCFSCERQIKSSQNAHLSFPSKCFDCEARSLRPYFQGPTKCFDCEHQDTFPKDELDNGKNYDECTHMTNSTGKFSTYWRNRFPNRA
jgi:hypothetical protein